MIALLLALACGPKLRTEEITLGGAPLHVEIADEEEERALGLMHRKHLDTDAGMLFVYGDSKVRSFWMKNTLIPLSIAFLDESGQIVRIADMEPLVTDPTSSLYPARFAVEVNQGWFSRHQVEKGDRIDGIDLERLKAPPR